LTRSSEVVRVEVRDHQMVDLPNAGLGCDIRDALCVTPSEAGPARVHQQRFSRRRYE
jgi:hypothetical protein